MRTSRSGSHACFLAACSPAIDKGPDEMTNYIKSETEKWGKVIRTLGTKVSH